MKFLFWKKNGNVAISNTHSVPTTLYNENKGFLKKVNSFILIPEFSNFIFLSQCTFHVDSVDFFFSYKSNEKSLITASMYCSNRLLERKKIFQANKNFLLQNKTFAKSFSIAIKDIESSKKTIQFTVKNADSAKEYNLLQTKIKIGSK